MRVPDFLPCLGMEASAAILKAFASKFNTLQVLLLICTVKDYLEMFSVKISLGGEPADTLSASKWESCG